MQSDWLNTIFTESKDPKRYQTPTLLTHSLHSDRLLNCYYSNHGESPAYLSSYRSVKISQTFPGILLPPWE